MPDSVPVPGETILLMEHLEGTPVHSGHIKAWTKRDPILSQVLGFILEGWPSKNSSKELNPYFTKRTELSVEDGCILGEPEWLYPRREDQRYSLNCMRPTLVNFA